MLSFMDFWCHLKIPQSRQCGPEKIRPIICCCPVNLQNLAILCQLFLSFARLLLFCCCCQLSFCQLCWVNHFLSMQFMIWLRSNTRTTSRSSETYPNCHVLVQSQQWKHHSNVWNLFKINDKDARCRTSFWFHFVNFVTIVNFEQILQII